MLFILWITSFLAKVEQITTQAQVSGNAIDLANMNMNMMNTKCPLEACQSVCLVEQQETGCFVCNPKCTSGTNIGMPDSGLPMQLQPINSGQTGYYSGCKHDNWMQCPFSCARSLDQKGCFKCQCKATTNIKGTTKLSTILSEGTTTPSKSPVTSYVSTRASSTFLKTKEATETPTSSVTTQSTTTEKSTKQKSTVSPTVISPSSVTTKTLQDDKVQIHTPENLGKTIDPLKYNTTHNKIIPEVNEENEKDRLYGNGSHAESDDFKLNNLTFILFAIMIVLATFCFVFLIAWRKSSQKLKKNKNELYFVHKAYRQDSRAHLSNNEMLDPVYADIDGPRPEPPPRSPPSLRTTSVSTGPARSLSQSSETPLKEHTDDVKHDYLELI